jgi:hypothetical protein
MIHALSPSNDQVLTLVLFQNQLTYLHDVQEKILDQMSSSPERLPLEVGEVLEDIANRYLDMSDLISERHFQARQEALASQTEMASEHQAAG